MKKPLGAFEETRLVKTGFAQLPTESPVRDATPGQRSTLAPFSMTRRKFGNALALALGDAFALVAALALADLIRWILVRDHMLPSWGAAIVVLWWVGAFAIGLLPGWGLGVVGDLRRQTILLTVVFALVLAGFFLMKSSSEASRMSMVLGYGFGLVLMPVVRLAVVHLLCRAGTWGVPAVIYGSNETVPLLVDALREARGMGYHPVGVFRDDPSNTEDPAAPPVLGALTDATHAAPVAVVGMQNLERHRLVEMLDGPLSFYRTVIIVPDLQEAPSLWVRPRDLQGIVALEISDNLSDLAARFVKRASDLLAVLLTLPLWLPLGAVISVLVWLGDRRSPFFSQERLGMDGRVFKMHKFRTMHVDAEELLRRKMDEDDALKEEWETHFKLKHDPRITPIGAVLRKTSLDELPQLVDVLLGNMSLVGPRPLPLYHYMELPESVRRLRERVRPGITGLWQVSGRSEASTDGMERWDTYYVRNWSMWLDIVILVRTVKVVLTGKGAY